MGVRVSRRGAEGIDAVEQREARAEFAVRMDHEADQRRQRRAHEGGRQQAAAEVTEAATETDKTLDKDPVPASASSSAS